MRLHMRERCDREPAERSGSIVMMTMRLLLAQSGFDLTMWPLPPDPVIADITQSPTIPESRALASAMQRVGTTDLAI